MLNARGEYKILITNRSIRHTSRFALLYGLKFPSTLPSYNRVDRSAIFAFGVYYMRLDHSAGPKKHRSKPPSVSTNNTKSDSSRSTGSTHTMVPSSPNSPDDMNSALLRPSTELDITSNINMFGKYKGFTLKPLQATGAVVKSPNVAFVHPLSKNSEDASSTVPSRPAPPAPKLKPVVPAHTVQIGNSTYNKPAGIHQINGYKLANHEHQMESAPALPPLNPGSTARPIISSPILESSTNTSREVNSGTTKAPIRPAPILPPVHSNPAGSQENIVPEVLINPTSKEKKPKEGKLNRITSYLKKDEKLPKAEPKNIKIVDKEKLKNLQISAPIPISSDLAQSMPKLNETESAMAIEPGVASVHRAKSMRDPEATGKRVPGDGQAASESPRKPSTLKRPQSMVGSRPTIPPPRPPVPPAPAITGMKIPGVPGYQNPPPPKSVTIVTPRRDYDDCNDVEEQSTTTTTTALGHDNIYSVIDESPSPPSILSPQATLSSGSSDSMGLLGEIVNEIESRGSDSVYIATTLKRDGGGMRKNSQAPKAEEEEVDDDDEPTYVNTSEIQDDDAPTEDEEPYPANLKSSVSTTSSGYLRPSAINAPIARVAPSKPESVSSNLSSFKNGGVNVFSTLQFEGPIAESSKPPATATVAKKSTTPAPYKPYHSTVANSRPGSVVTATKSKISQDKQLANGAAPKLNRNPTPPNITTNGRKPLGSSVRTRSPSPKGRIANGGVTAAKAVAPQKPKTPAKPESVVKPKISSSSSSASSKILTAAARPAPGKASNVASLQQKFETKK